MELKDTVELMTSEDYKERFRAEYWQTKIRYDRLMNMLELHDAGTLHFTLTETEVLKQQATAMRIYLYMLKERAELEQIHL